MRVLAGDVGGTNLRLALVDVPGGSSRPVIVDRLRVSVDEQAGVEAPIKELLAKHGGIRPPTCIGVAGPIAGGQAQLTGVNMPWTIDARKVSAAVGLPRMTLVNDFHAAARGVDVPDAFDRVVKRCLERDPNMRYADVAGLALSLVEFAPEARLHAERARRVLGGAPLPTPEAARKNVCFMAGSPRAFRARS